MNAPVISAPKASGAPIILALSAAAGIVFFHLACAWFGFSQYRDQHLGTALVYARDGIDLLRPVIVGFNANNAPTPLEFPLWQSAASLPLRWFGGWLGWANIVSLLFFSPRSTRPNDWARGWAEQPSAGGLLRSCSFNRSSGSTPDWRPQMAPVSPRRSGFSIAEPTLFRTRAD